MDFLDKLRQKDSAKRNLIALISALVITLMIAGVWLTTRTALDGSSSRADTSGSGVIATTTEADGPISTLKNGFEQFMAETGKLMRNLNKNLESVNVIENTSDDYEGLYNE